MKYLKVKNTAKNGKTYKVKLPKQNLTRSQVRRLVEEQLGTSYHSVPLIKKACRALKKRGLLYTSRFSFELDYEDQMTINRIMQKAVEENGLTAEDIGSSRHKYSGVPATVEVPFSEKDDRTVSLPLHVIIAPTGYQVRGASKDKAKNKELKKNLQAYLKK